MQSANNWKKWKYIKQNKFNILIILNNKICQKFADDNMIDNIDINIIKQEKKCGRDNASCRIILAVSHSRTLEDVVLKKINCQLWILIEEGLQHW